MGSKKFNGPPAAINQIGIGDTEDPCGLAPFPLPGQTGPANGLHRINLERITSINDGSPDSNGIKAFNVLSGLGVTPATFWENIGSKIVFDPSVHATEPRIAVQPYPTYAVFQNGKFIGGIPQAPEPSHHFYPNPYPFGTVPCQNVPGGRCGNAQLPADPSARVPPSTYTQP